MMTDCYLTLEGSAHSEIKIRGSRFIGFANPIKDRGDVEQIISERLKAYYNATHHCYAYVIGFEPSIEMRAHDDGEPAGTAGKPILDVIQGMNLTGVICVVTRYFGGIKLGAGGLARAYSQCARETFDASRIVRRYHMDRIRLKFPYSLTGTVMPILSKHDADIRATEYGDDTVLEIQVRQSRSKTLTDSLENASGGRVLILGK